MTTSTRKPLVGISSCLLGERVRYDGGHRYDALINTELAELFEFRACCPEVTIGLGVPRKPIQLVRTGQGLRVRGVENPSMDVTRALDELGERIATEFAGICGYIFKARSPSCGPAGVATWSEQGESLDMKGTGAFAAALSRTLPGLAITDEVALRNPLLREQFIAGVTTRWQHNPG